MNRSGAVLIGQDASGPYLPATVSATGFTTTAFQVLVDGATTPIPAYLGFDTVLAVGDRVWVQKIGFQTTVMARQAQPNPSKLSLSANTLPSMRICYPTTGSGLATTWARIPCNTITYQLGNISLNGTAIQIAANGLYDITGQIYAHNAAAGATVLMMAGYFIGSSATSPSSKGSALYLPVGNFGGATFADTEYLTVGTLVYLGCYSGGGAGQCTTQVDSIGGDWYLTVAARQLF